MDGDRAIEREKLRKSRNMAEGRGKMGEDMEVGINGAGKRKYRRG